MNWRDVESSNIQAIGWPEPGQAIVEAQVDPQYVPKGELWQPKLLVVIFRDGRAYGYLGVSRQRASYISRAPSPGGYVERVVKPNFKTVRIPELDRKVTP